MDKYVQLIKEFIEFAKDVDTSSKSVKTLHRLIVTPKDLSKDIKDKLLEQARKTFTTVDFYNITGSDVFEFKMGQINLGRLKDLCEKDEEDVKTFTQFMVLFQKTYEAENAAVVRLLKELDLEENSPEASFLRKIFNEIGKDFIELVQNNQTGLDINSLLPKIANLVKGGKLTEIMTDFTDSGVRMSKVMFAVGKLLEKYETAETTQKLNTTIQQTVEEIEDN